MFPNDLLHGLIRHSAAHHGRETIAFGRRANALLERMWLLAVWRNFVKKRSEREPGLARSPAMDLGLTNGMWRWERVLGQRLFPSREVLDREEGRVYARALVTPTAGRNRPHALRLAF